MYSKNFTLAKAVHTVQLIKKKNVETYQGRRKHVILYTVYCTHWHNYSYISYLSCLSDWGINTLIILSFLYYFFIKVYETLYVRVQRDYIYVHIISFLFSLPTIYLLFLHFLQFTEVTV